jgi:hypothetical protein
VTEERRVPGKAGKEEEPVLKDWLLIEKFFAGERPPADG